MSRRHSVLSAADPCDAKAANERQLDAVGNQHGAHGDANENIAKLLDALRDVPEENRGAHFHCTIVLLRSPDDPAPLIAEGHWHDRILHTPRGTSGFGYDPVFFDGTLGAGAAELDAATKNRVSHRGLALARLRELLLAPRQSTLRG